MYLTVMPAPAINIADVSKFLKNDVPHTAPLITNEDFTPKFKMIKIMIRGQEIDFTQQRKTSRVNSGPAF